MSSQAFKNYTSSIQDSINSLNNSLSSIEREREWSKTKTKTESESKKVPPEQSKKNTDEVNFQKRIDKVKKEIEELKEFYVDVKEEWGSLDQRVVGYVVWAPSIGAGSGSGSGAGDGSGEGGGNRYMRDLCVIKLDKRRFKNFCGNVMNMNHKGQPDFFFPSPPSLPLSTHPPTHLAPSPNLQVLTSFSR